MQTEAGCYSWYDPWLGKVNTNTWMQNTTIEGGGSFYLEHQ
jgi:hypothetical protein